MGGWVGAEIKKNFSAEAANFLVDFAPKIQRFNTKESFKFSLPIDGKMRVDINQLLVVPSSYL